MKNSKFGEITYCSWLDKSIFCDIYANTRKSSRYTYIYKDLKEYKIDGLYLYKPIFKVDNGSDKLIHINDIGYTYEDGNKKEIDISYIVDLQNQTFIRTK